MTYFTDLRQRLDGIAQLAQEMNAKTFGGPDDWHAEAWQQPYRRTGFVPMQPGIIADAIHLLRRKKESGTSLELGCGTGTWAVMAAAAGYASYGIDINPHLVGLAQELRNRARGEGLIPEDQTCEFAAGDMFFGESRTRYRRFARSARTESYQMPLAEDIGEQHRDAYAQLGIALGEIDIIYAWAWPRQDKFLYEFLDENARHDAIFAIAHHATSEARRSLPITPITQLRSITIGPRRER